MSAGLSADEIKALEDASWTGGRKAWLAAIEDIIAARLADHEAQIRDLLEEREELLTEIRRLQRGNHPAGRALRLGDDRLYWDALREALTERDAGHEGGEGA